MVWKPKGARIIVMPNDQEATRELNISRALIIAILVLSILLASLIITIVISFGGLLQQARRVPALEGELDDARARLAQVRELNVELEAMRGVQEQVLMMLGASEGRTAADVVDWSEGAETSPGASIETATIITPPPGRWPVRGYVTNEFREGRISEGIRPHLGIDLVAPVGTEIVAAGAGVVRQAGWDDFLGNFVEISHGFGYVTTYGHCAGVDVARGDRVDVGQRIATLGGSGQVSAPHLHFEVWRDDQAIDPRLVISGNPDYTD